VIGQADIIQRLTREQLVAFYRASTCPLGLPTMATRGPWNGWAETICSATIGAKHGRLGERQMWRARKLAAMSSVCSRGFQEVRSTSRHRQWPALRVPRRVLDRPAQ
jgi:hypothetical protein